MYKIRYYYTTKAGEEITVALRTLKNPNESQTYKKLLKKLELGELDAQSVGWQVVQDYGG